MTKTLPDKNLKVLWADDEANKEKYVSSRELLEAQFTLIVAETIDDARKVIETTPPPDLLILDIIFKEKSEGLQLLDDIGNAKYGVMSTIKVVVLTADSYLLDIEKILKIVNKNTNRMRFSQKMIRAKELAKEIMEWVGTPREYNQ